MRQTETKLLFVGQILPRHFAWGLKEVHLLRRSYNDIMPL